METKEILTIVEKASEVYELTKDNLNEPHYWANISNINLFADHIKKVAMEITGRGQMNIDGYIFTVDVKRHKFAFGECYEWDKKDSIGYTIGELSAFIDKMKKKTFRISMLSRLDGICVKIIGERIAYVKNNTIHVSVVESIGKKGIFLENGHTISANDILDASDFKEVEDV